MVQIFIQAFSRQSIAWNTVANHTAQLCQTFVHGYLMPHQLQIISRSHTAWAAAYNGNSFTGRRCICRCRNIFRMVYRVAFQRANIDGIVHHIAAAVVFTWVFTHKGTSCREWIVLANQLYRIAVTAFPYQRHITRNIYLRRTERYTWHALTQIAQASAFFDMGCKIIFKLFYTVIRHSCCLVSDGAISCEINTFCCFFDQCQCLHIGCTVQHILHHLHQLTQPNTARYTLPAALAVRQTQKCLYTFYRTQPVRVGRQTICQFGIQSINGVLSLLGTV